MQEWEKIIFAVSNTITQLHFTFKILSFFWFMLLCPQWISSYLLKWFFAVSFKGSASFLCHISGNLLKTLLNYFLILLLLLCSISCKSSCSYHIFVPVSQIYFDTYGTIYFTSCSYMTLINTSLFSLLTNDCCWKSFCSLQMEEGWRRNLN